MGAGHAADVFCNIQRYIKIFLGETTNNRITGNGSYSSPSVYLKSKVFLAEDATDILGAFLNIAKNISSITNAHPPE